MNAAKELELYDRITNALQLIEASGRDEVAAKIWLKWLTWLHRDFRSDIFE